MKTIKLMTERGGGDATKQPANSTAAPPARSLAVESTSAYGLLHKELDASKKIGQRGLLRSAARSRKPRRWWLLPRGRRGGAPLASKAPTLTKLLSH